MIIRALSVDRVATFANMLGLPPGLMQCFELEAARLQLAFAVYRHKSISCDHGCEGEDTATSSDETDSSWERDSFTGPSLTISNTEELDSSLADIDSDLSFEASVPARPRELSSSSSSSSSEEDNNDEQGVTVRRSRRRRGPRASSTRNNSLSEAIPGGQNRLAESGELDHQWFSFEGGDAEEQATRRYVMRNLRDGFDQSTDSSSDNEA